MNILISTDLAALGCLDIDSEMHCIHLRIEDAYSPVYKQDVPIYICEISKVKCERKMIKVGINRY